MICWFEEGVTDSFGPQLAGLRDGLGFLPGSACPHYDGEELRRPVYTGLVADGFPSGLALDDAAAARFESTELVELVVSDAEAGGYRVAPSGEEALPKRVL
jgi:peptidase E